MMSGSVEWLKRMFTMLGLSVNDDVVDARCAPHISVNVTCRQFKHAHDALSDLLGLREPDDEDEVRAFFFERSSFFT
jgi:hypothetical protein